MQARALRAFQRSTARLQALAEDDFKKVAEENMVPRTNAQSETVDDRPPAAPSNPAKNSSDGDAGDNGTHEDAEEESDPTPSLSAVPRGVSVSNGRDKFVKMGQGADSPEEEGKRRIDSEEEPLGEEEEAGPGAICVRDARSASTVSAAALRVLRATVVVLGGCGLGALPSDVELWRAVRPMLLDGTLRHRVRHFDRQVVKRRE